MRSLKLKNMALGIKTSDIYVVYDIPFFSAQDEHWQDNTWICEHLRQLADTIERDKIKIFKTSLEFDHNYKIPHLQITTFKK